jgi:hypothetical protein
VEVTLPADDKMTETKPLAAVPSAKRNPPEEAGAGKVKVGQTLEDRYLVIEEIGSGALGSVYRVKDLRLDREVALKLLHKQPLHEAGTGGLAERVAREARAVARLDHPNIAPVHDAGELDGVPFLTMGLVRGRSLSEVLRDGGPMGVRRALALFRQVCAALDYAHRHGVIHCDVKPSNILLEDGERVRLVDFGLARLRRAAGPERHEEVFGTAGYTAPEVVKGEDPGPRSDLFSAGAVLYKMLTGGDAFTGGSLGEIVEKVLGEEPAPPHAVRKGVPKGFARVLATALAKFPEQRYPDGRSVVRALELRLWWRKMTRLLGATGLALTLAAAAFGAWWAARPLEVEGGLWAELAREGEGHAAVPVQDGAVLRAGDRLWLSDVTPNRDAYLYVFILDPRSNLDQLFPSRGIPVSLPLEGRRTYQIPPEDQRWVLDATQGFETFFVAASRSEVEPPEMEGLIDRAGGEAIRMARSQLDPHRGVEVQRISPSLRREQEEEVERLLRERFPVLRRYSIVHE